MHIPTSSIPPRYFEREFGIEFTPYELRRKDDIRKALINKSKEVSGYVRWLPAPNGFLIMPTTTTADPHIACVIEPWSGINRPPERSFINAKGKWSYWARGYSDSTSQRFIVTSFEEMKPDLGEMKPDLRYHDFKEILFEGIFNVDAATQDFIAHSFVSSPTSLGRIGGLSLSLYNEYDRHKKAGILQRYLLGFLPKEVLVSESYEISVEGLQRLELDPFGWSYKSLDIESLVPRQTSELLARPVDQAALSQEISISLFSKDRKPKSLRDPAAALSDAPIVVERDVEKGRGVFEPDPKVFQFMVATHVVQTALPDVTYKKSLKYIDQELEKLMSEYPLLLKESGRGMLLDLNIHGKPRSLLHLGLSDGRSSLQQEVTLDAVEKAVKLFIDNLENAMVAWEDIHPTDKDFNLAGIAPEARKIIGFIIRNGPSSRITILEYCRNDMSESVFDRTWSSIYNGGLIYHKGNDIFDVIPFLSDLRQ